METFDEKIHRVVHGLNSGRIPCTDETYTFQHMDMSGHRFVTVKKVGGIWFAPFDAN